MRIHDTFRNFVERGRLGDFQLIRSYLLFSEEAVQQIVVRDLIKFESSVVVGLIKIWYYIEGFYGLHLPHFLWNLVYLFWYSCILMELHQFQDGSHLKATTWSALFKLFIQEYRCFGLASYIYQNHRAYEAYSIKTIHLLSYYMK